MQSNSSTVITNARVHTLDANSTVAQSISFRDGTITAVGNNEDVLARNPNALVIDAAGFTITPGFVDAHAHMDRMGLYEIGGIPLDGVTSIDGVVERVRDAARREEPGKWIVLLPMGGLGSFFNDPSQFVEGRFPDRHDLDRAAPRNPVYIRSVWGWWSQAPFPAVANTMALETLGIDRQTTAPYNVEIVRDANGEPTGVFLDSNYQSMLEHTLFAGLPRFSFADRVESVRLGSMVYAKLGTTSIIEGHGLSPEIIRAYRAVHGNGELKQRARLAMSPPTARFDGDRIEDLLLHLSGIASDNGVGDERLRIEGLSLDVADPRVAELISEDYPYVAWASHFTQGLSPTELVALGRRAAELGIRVHGMAGYGLDRVLGAFEAIHRAVPIDERRWVLTHLLSASEEQLERIRNLGLVVTVNPMFLYGASEKLGLVKLGNDAMPLRRWIDAGIMMAFETDGAPPSMLRNLWQTMVRWDGRRETTIGTDDVSREEALRLICQGGHLLNWREHRAGVLSTGWEADLVVLDDDPLACDIEKVPEIRVMGTVVAGEFVFDRDGFASTREVGRRNA